MKFELLVVQSYSTSNYSGSIIIYLHGLNGSDKKVTYPFKVLRGSREGRGVKIRPNFQN